MSTIADNFIKDGSFGRRLLAMLASFYAIALIWGQKAGEGKALGYEVIASVLRGIGLNNVSDWIVDTLMTSLRSSPVAAFAAMLVLAGSVLSMTATYRRSVFNVSPQAAFASLFAACVLIDLGAISPRDLAIGAVITAVLVGAFCLLPSDDKLIPAPVVGLFIVLGPAAAILYGPAKVVSWSVSESPPQTVPVALERGSGPVKVELVDRTGPEGARLP